MSEKKSDAVIRGEGLVKDYGKRRVVDNVSVEVRSSQVVGLLGPNGAGKTTTFKMMVGFTSPNAGKVLFDGRDISGLPIHLRARLGMSYLAQEHSVFQNLTVRENLMAVLQAQGQAKKDIRPKVNSLLEEFGIEHLEHNQAGRLSGGEKRRLEIARALMTSPAFILLDEPFTGIDPHTIEDVQKIVRTLAQRGIGILITDHNVRETMKITDRSYILIDGHVKASGTTREILDNKEVTDRYITQSIKEDLSRRTE